MPRAPKEWPSQKHPYKCLRIGKKRVVVDALIADAIGQLNRLGCKTLNCCQGDQTVRDDNGSDFTVGAYIAIHPCSRFPHSLVDAAKLHGFSLMGSNLLTVGGASKRSGTARQVRADNRRFVRMLNQWREGNT